MELHLYRTKMDTTSSALSDTHIILHLHDFHRDLPIEACLLSLFRRKIQPILPQLQTIHVDTPTHWRDALTCDYDARRQSLAGAWIWLCLFHTQTFIEEYTPTVGSLPYLIRRRKEYKPATLFFPHIEILHLHPEWNVRETEFTLRTDPVEWSDIHALFPALKMIYITMDWIPRLRGSIGDVELFIACAQWQSSHGLDYRDDAALFGGSTHYDLDGVVDDDESNLYCEA
jgi:hypothetical protein